MQEETHLTKTFIRIAQNQLALFEEELARADADFRANKYSADDYSLITRLLKNDIESVELRLRLYRRN